MRTGLKWWQWLILGLSLLLAVRSGAAVWRLYGAGERVKEARRELDQARQTNRELREKLEEVESEEFVEKEAREKLGMGWPGEEMLLLPPVTRTDTDKPRWQADERPNWKKWWDLYIRI